MTGLPHSKNAWFSWADLQYGAVNSGQKRARWLESVPDGPEEHRSGVGGLLLLFHAPRVPRDIRVKQIFSCVRAYTGVQTVATFSDRDYCNGSAYDETGLSACQTHLPDSCV